MVPRLLSHNFSYLHRFSMPRVGCSCSAQPAFSTSWLTSASLLHMFEMEQHGKVVIFWEDDEVNVMVTWEFHDSMAFFCLQPTQGAWWCHGPIMWYIKMILWSKELYYFIQNLGTDYIKKLWPIEKLFWESTFCHKMGHNIIQLELVVPATVCSSSGMRDFA